MLIFVNIQLYLLRYLSKSARLNQGMLSFVKILERFIYKLFTDFTVGSTCFFFNADLLNTLSCQY